MKEFLKKIDWNKWQKNVLLFLAPLGIMYVTFAIAAIHSNHDIFVPSVLIPDPYIIGAMALYILNAALDLLKKINAARKV